MLTPGFATQRRGDYVDIALRDPTVHLFHGDLDFFSSILPTKPTSGSYRLEMSVDGSGRLANIVDHDGGDGDPSAVR